MNHPVIFRRMSGPASRPVSSHPFHFVYFVAAADQLGHAAYHDQLVLAEVLLRRAFNAKIRGVQPVNLRLHDELEQRCFRRPRPGSCPKDSAEFARWVDHDGFNRPRPLNREQLTRELMDRHGASLLRAIDLATSASHALSGEDQAWLEARARLPALDRPLNGTEYLILVRALEAAYAAPRGRSNACAVNAEIALRAARRLGGLHPDYTPSPFRIAALSMAYKAGHHDHLARRAAFACAAEQRLRFSRARPRLKIDAKLARNRTEHAAFLACRALAVATALGGQFTLAEPTVRARAGVIRAPVMGFSPCRYGMPASVALTAFRAAHA